MRRRTLKILALAARSGHSPRASSGLGPAVEFNYGILPDSPFHIIVPYAYDRTQGLPGQGGLGDTEVGIKYSGLPAGLDPEVTPGTAGGSLRIANSYSRSLSK
jgi:hypothetical protein